MRSPLADQLHDTITNICFGQEGRAEHKKYMHPVQFKQDFQTVGIAAPRRSGKTTAIMDLYCQYRASFWDATYYVVAANHEIRRLFVEHYRERYPYDLEFDSGILIPSDFRTLGRTRADIIFIDEPDLLSAKQILDVYEFSEANLYALVGTPLFRGR